ncbi:MAG TPA: hypothetical protein VFF33_10505 [Ignavibacteriaceae bacterium]|nr:hypothetical protein [Ignavibacteriaceae bacterium]
MKKSLLFLGIFFFLTNVNAQIFNVADPQLVIKAENNNFFMNPVFSNDGNTIAYTGSNYKGIYLYDVNSKTSTQLTDEDAAGFSYKWSSDSKYLLTKPAMFDKDGKRFNFIKLFNAETKEGKVISEYTTSSIGLPEFSNNNDAVFYFTKQLEVKSTGITTNKAVNSSNDNFIYLDFDKVIVENRNNNTKTIIANFNGSTLLNLAISLDKKQVAFEVMGGHLYTVNIDGTSLTDLEFGYRPKWSADGKFLTYTITKDDGYNFTESDIYVYDLAKQLKQNLTDTPDVLELSPSFSPDGKSIIYQNFNDGSIYSINITAK